MNSPTGTPRTPLPTARRYYKEQKSHDKNFRITPEIIELLDFGEIKEHALPCIASDFVDIDCIEGSQWGAL